MTAGGLHLPGNPALRVGGSELILSFFEEALRLGAERLQVLAPYVDDRVFVDEPFRHVWSRLVPTTDATVVVRTPGAAEAVLRCSNGRWPQFDLRLNPRLHAKVFVAHRPGWEIALAGSHNLTAAALHANDEVGILIRPGGIPELRKLVRELRWIAEAVARKAARYSGARGA